MSDFIYVQQFPWSLSVDLFQNRVWKVHLCKYDNSEGKGYITSKYFIIWAFIKNLDEDHVILC